MFDAKTLAQIKERHTLTLRTPQEYKHISTLYLILFFAAWWGVYLIWAHKHKNSDNSVIAILMSLTGLCFLMMQSLYDPLEDALYGIDMAQGIIIGVVVIGILQYVNFTKLYQDRLRIGFDIPLACIKWLFKPFSKKISGLIQVLSNKKYKAHRKWIALLGIILSLPLLLLDLIRILWLGLIRIFPILGNWVEALIAKPPKGCGYLLTALLLTALLFLFGSGPSGMKVNFELSGMTFQPSEIAKYLIVFFMAAFFSCNADSIIKYSKKGNLRLFGHKFKILFVITIGLCLLLLLYLKLGDMGPALVLAFTFKIK
ncbi:MAG: FtsW/RodA/SpoVE family cell cycle protein [Odoribacter sp.]|nr:FtsW/RodA/SpoVE family cell cycle protein [Odoribacter sp.]